VAPTLELVAWLLSAASSVVLVMVNLRKDDAKGQIILPFIDGGWRSVPLRDLHSDEVRDRTLAEWAEKGSVFKVRGGGARIWVDAGTHRQLAEAWAA
jgi:hypothetical protein